MSHYFSKTATGSFETVREKIVAALKTEGFGVLIEIDVQATLQQKIGANFLCE